jgi:hypothetical protein
MTDIFNLALKLFEYSKPILSRLIELFRKDKKMFICIPSVYRETIENYIGEICKREPYMLFNLDVDYERWIKDMPEEQVTKIKEIVTSSKIFRDILMKKFIRYTTSVFGDEAKKIIYITTNPTLIRELRLQRKAKFYIPQLPIYYDSDDVTKAIVDKFIADTSEMRRAKKFNNTTELLELIEL